MIFIFEKDFALRLKTLRNQRGMKQETVAIYIGVVRSTYAYYETGKTQPSLKTIIKLSELYRVSTDFILTGKLNK